MTDYYQLSDAEWEWVACFLEDRTAPSADALRGYLNDRITERLVTARAEERERTQGIIEELENHIDHLPGHIYDDLRVQLATLPELDHEAQIAVRMLLDGSK